MKPLDEAAIACVVSSDLVAVTPGMIAWADGVHYPGWVMVVNVLVAVGVGRKVYLHVLRDRAGEVT